LGLDHRIGTLEPRKDADFCALALAEPATVPTHDPLGTLFHAARGPDVVLTVVEGKVLYADGEFRTVDAAAAREAIVAVGERLRGAL
jgi:5-methylthioadenosine/S-adenosylhomocysteine deaminase